MAGMTSGVDHVADNSFEKHSSRDLRALGAGILVTIADDIPHLSRWAATPQLVTCLRMSLQ